MSDTSPARGTPIRSISAVLPAYNEAANIIQVVEAALDALHDAVPDFELIVVDDGSVDGTARIVADLSVDRPGIHLVRHARNRGYGSAWRSGIAAATKQYIVFMDADRQYDPAEIAALVQWGDKYDLVAGVRLRRGDSLYRRLSAVCFRILLRLFLGVRARDVTCGFKLVRAGLVQPLDLQATGVMIAPEIHYRAQQQGAALREVGVHHYPRRAGTQTGGRPRTLLRAAIELFAFRRRIRRERHEAAARTTEQPPPDA